jgi:hypothetical protein
MRVRRLRAAAVRCLSQELLRQVPQVAESEPPLRGRRVAARCMGFSSTGDSDAADVPMIPI